MHLISDQLIILGIQYTTDYYQLTDIKQIGIINKRNDIL